MKKIKILGLITEDNAVGYYRIWQPLKMLEKLGLAELKLTPTFNWGKDKKETLNFPELSWFSTDKDPFYPDIIVGQRHDYIHYISLVGGLAKGFKAPLVIDTDDDVQAVRPFNPGYASYNPESDNTAFNVKLMSIPHLSAITTSTNQLKERHEHYGKPIYVVPNSIDIETRTFKPKAREKKIRIGWLGSACHWENLQIIRQAVIDIIQKYPNVEFIYTNLYGDIWNNVPKEYEDRVIPACRLMTCKRRHGVCQKVYCTLDKYAKQINDFKLDIGLAPLYDNLFNRAKSNLRILEYWADKLAVIASPVRPYKETIIHGKNGLLAQEKHEWFAAMEALILDEKMRNDFKEEGWKTLNKDYSAEKNAKKLYKIYKKIIDDYAESNKSTY